MSPSTTKRATSGTADIPEPRKEAKRKIPSLYEPSTMSETEPKKMKVESELQVSDKQMMIGLHPTTASLLETGKWSDLVIVCQGREWKVHRTVVCVQSPALEAMEVTAGIIDLSANEPEVVECMIKFFYTNDYSDGVSISAPRTESQRSTASPAPTASHLVTNATISSPSPAPATPATSPTTIVGAIGSSVLHDLNVLRATIETDKPERFRSPPSVRLLLNTKVYILAGQFSLLPLKAAAVRKFQAALDNVSADDLIKSLCLMHSKTTKHETVLKDIALDYAVNHVGILMARADFREFCDSKSANGFLLRMMDRMTEMVVKKCPKCKTNAGVRVHKNTTKQHKYEFKYSCTDCKYEFH